MTTTLVIVAFAAAYILIATERIHRVAAALRGAAAMVLVGVVDARVAFLGQETGVDWNGIILLLGMMVIVSVMRQGHRAPGHVDRSSVTCGGGRAGCPGQSLWWALVLGADLGGNATAVGASANVTLGIAARNGHPISFWTFTRYGLVVPTVTVTISWLYVWLRYFALA